MSPLKDIQFSPPKEIKLPGLTGKAEPLTRSRAFPDLAKYGGRFYLAFRTAPSHFTSPRARIHIYSSTDGQNWLYEHTVDRSRDVRDPRFLVFNGELYLFFMGRTLGRLYAGSGRTLCIKKNGSGWTSPYEIPYHNVGFWDVKSHEGRIYLSLYARNGIRRHTDPHFRLVASSDLENWQSVFESPFTRQTLLNYRTSESAFDFDNNGMVFGTIRSLIYPNLNFSILPESPNHWRIQVDRYKYDGPKFFKHGGTHFLTARRSLFYRLPAEPFRFFKTIRNLVNILRYSLSRKRTALYHFDRDSLSIHHITDLPSHGDTGYSAVAHISGNRYLLVYYSSDITSGKDLSWLRGQNSPTFLYSSELQIY